MQKYNCLFIFFLCFVGSPGTCGCDVSHCPCQSGEYAGCFRGPNNSAPCSRYAPNLAKVATETQVFAELGWGRQMVKRVWWYKCLLLMEGWSLHHGLMTHLSFFWCHYDTIGQLYMETSMLKLPESLEWSLEWEGRSGYMILCDFQTDRHGYLFYLKENT